MRSERFLVAPRANLKVLVRVRTRWLPGVCAALLLPAAADLRGQGRPANVLVVVNRSSPDSVAIAEYYVRRRSIPPGNICPIEAPDTETIARDVYDRKVEAGLRSCLSSRDPANPILYIATTRGVPLRISGTGDQKNTTAAAVDSELAALPMRLAGRPAPLDGPIANPYFRKQYARFDPKLFPILPVTRLAAYDVATVRKMIDRCLAASNRGRFVIDMKEGSEDAGESWLRDAAVFLPGGRVTINQDKEVLRSQVDVIGYAAWGSNDRNRKQRFLGFRWLPGAIVTDFVSSNGRTFIRPPKDWNISTWQEQSRFYAGTPQSLTADYLEEGASGASGHVYEPYLAMTPRPELLFPAYYSGRSLAESYYLATPAVSWMNLVAGDPLCALGPPR